MKKVTILPYVVVTGWYTNKSVAIEEATAHGCDVVEIFGETRGFVPIHNGEFLTCKYGGIPWVAYKQWKSTH